MKIKLSEPERQKSEGQYSWQEANHRKLCSDLFQAKKRESLLTAEGALIFASVLPDCGMQLDVVVGQSYV